jgi:hypothetical protein
MGATRRLLRMPNSAMRSFMADQSKPQRWGVWFQRSNCSWPLEVGEPG